jgi:hypothetical protein
MSEYYPGSKMKRNMFLKDESLCETPDNLELHHPRTATLKGVETNFYTIGELARLLNRKPVTIRKWESDGIIPKATFIAPSGDKRGKRRLYTEDQILGLLEIAREEGILEPNANGAWKAVHKTQFRSKSISLFKRLADEQNK